MKKIFKKIAIVGLVSSVIFTTTSCIGGFRLFNNVVKWNKSMSKEPFINEIVFVILWVLPVYEVAMLGDLFIFNSIEFWTGNNVLTINEGEIIEKSIFHNNQEYYVKASRNKVEITPKDKDTVIFTYNDEENLWSAESNGEIIKLDENNLKMIQAVALGR